MDTTQPTKPTTPTISGQQLDMALYHAVDITDRCLLPFMLFDTTAQTIIQDSLLSGTEICLAVKQSDLNEFALSTLRTLAKGADNNLGMQDFTETDEGFQWVYRDVPIKLKVIKGKFKSIQNPDFVYYMAEQYRIPNPFTEYWKVRHLVK